MIGDYQYSPTPYQQQLIDRIMEADPEILAVTIDAVQDNRLNGWRCTFTRHKQGEIISGWYDTDSFSYNLLDAQKRATKREASLKLFKYGEHYNIVKVFEPLMRYDDELPDDAVAESIGHLMDLWAVAPGAPKSQPLERRAK